MLAHGIVVSHETIRTWCAKFGPEYARGLRRRAPESGDKWFLDEVFVKVGGHQEVPVASGRSGWQCPQRPGSVTTQREGGETFLRQADAQAGPGAEGAGDQQACQLRCGASGVDAIGRTPPLEIPQQPGRELAPIHQAARTRDEGLSFTRCGTTVYGSI